MRKMMLPLAAVAAIAVAGFAMLQLQSDADSRLTLNTGTALPEPKEIADFELLDHNGRSFSQQNFEGRWSLLFAGFTHCPDICPATLAQLSHVEEQLHAKGMRLQTVLLTVDPQRDTPQRLAEYVGHFNPRFVGATGAKAQIDSLCDSLGLAYVHVPGSGGEYTVDHSAALVLIDPQARVAAYFTPPLDVEALARDLATLPPPI